LIDWDNDDVNLLTWRAATAETNLKTVATTATISSQEYFDNGCINDCNAWRRIPLTQLVLLKSRLTTNHLHYIANTVARKKLYEMNRIISDTAEYGCYLFDHACKPLLTDFMKTIETNVIETFL
jgi:ketol-acid reductoisomerase